VILERRGCQEGVGRLLCRSLLALGLLGSLASGRAAAAGEEIRVLLLSGQNNHDWKATTPELLAILRESGGFAIDVNEKPELITVRLLEPYDVILSNWNSFGLDLRDSDWPAEVRTAYLDFVRRGKGHVVVHAGSSSFPDWGDYRRLTLANWKMGQTSHGPNHEFPVRMENASHPVTAGLRTFTITDELWRRPGLVEEAEVLASSFSAADTQGTEGWEPAVLAGRFGEGRSLTVLLGHDVRAMANPGFRQLVRRAVEWAATGKVAARKSQWLREDGALTLVGPSGPLWQLRYSPELDTPYFHPLNTADGRALTWDRPPDHVWHHGLWFSWKFINTVNYWEIDGKTGRPAGQTTWSNVRVETAETQTARIAMDLAYRPAGEDVPVLTEERTIEARPPDAEGTYSMDWTLAFRAVQKVVLDRTPIPGEPGGQGWGGYSGLSLRLAAALAERGVASSDGPIIEMPEDRHRGRHTAVDYSGVIDGKPEGIAVLDNPRNPGSPTPWYVIRSADMSFFSPAVLCYGPITLEAGQRLALRYRVIVHHGRWDSARLNEEYAKYSRQTHESK
jgi:type 1 glutamine amidotransferase